jgi:hypothetical protein
MRLRIGKPRAVAAATVTLWLGAVLCCAARADDFSGNFSGVYVGGNFGRALNSYNTGYVDQVYETQASELGSSVGVTSRSVHRFVDVWWGDAGYYFTPYVALDAAYLHLGELRYKTTGEINVGGAENPTATSTEVISRGPALSVLGRLPLTDSFEADLRLGDYFGKTGFYSRIEAFGESSVVTASKTSSSLLAGIGGAYTFAGHWSVRVDYLRVQKTGDSASSGKFSINVASAGVSFTF